jgi:hemerythrin-like metal-binding protein
MNTILTDKDKIGIEIIDKQHENLHQLAVKLNYAFAEQNNIETKNLMNQIVDEMTLHFETEEKFMRENNCFEISHMLEHQRYLEKTKNYLKAILANKKNAVPEFLQSFRLWFYNHLEINDRKLAKAIK